MAKPIARTPQISLNKIGQKNDFNVRESALFLQRAVQ